jgi:predicted nuclease of predicted toxin-antitoxin system
MRVFLDACIDPRVTECFPVREVETAAGLGWERLKDHELIPRLQGVFDVLVTIDQGFEHQHNLKALRLGIVIVHVAKNKVEFYRPLFSRLRAAVANVKAGEIIHVYSTPQGRG